MSLVMIARAACAVALLGSSLSASAERLVGYVRDAATQRYLYTEVHESVQGADGVMQTALTIYYDAQGKEMARRALDFRASRTVPIYRLDIPGQGYAEGITAVKPQVTAFKLDKGKEERKTLTIEDGPVAADAGFNQLLLDLLPKIKAGETVRFQLIVAGRTQIYRFRARKIADEVVGGVPAVRLLVEPDSMLRMVVAPLELIYDAKGTRLMSYQGLSNILDPSTGQAYKKILITYGGPAPAEAIWPGSAQSETGAR
jgi:hypothetical protein